MGITEIINLILLAIAGSLFIEYNKIKVKLLLYKMAYEETLNILKKIDPILPKKIDEITKREEM